MRSIILAAFFLMAPARSDAQTVLEKQPQCSSVPAIALAAPEPAVIYHPVYVSKRKVYGLVSIFYALEMLKPCESPGRIRSRKDAKCYQKSRLP